jgi:hypothetical protein
MLTDLMAAVDSLRLPREEIAARTRDIYQDVLRQSRHVDRGNFTAIHQEDLRRLFDSYDAVFFNGQCRAAALAKSGQAATNGSGPPKHGALKNGAAKNGASKNGLGNGVLYVAPREDLSRPALQFRLSKRMTSAGGKTTRFKPRGGPVFFEIAVSTTLLFQTFHDVERPITVAGIVCRDRLEALQRVVEHEIVHLIEMLLWTHSSCSANRFQSIAARAFGHVEHTHQLITPRERALRKFGIRTGDRVRFELDGAPMVGVVNRITRRATVLVEDPRGMRYTDGKRYAKYYVPLAMLEPVTAVRS